jgi:hypothetical protein
MPTRPRFFRQWVNIQIKVLYYYAKHRSIIAPLIGDPTLLAALDLAAAKVEFIKALNDAGPN